jgi:hypothetical protein
MTSGASSRDSNGIGLGLVKGNAHMTLSRGCVEVEVAEDWARCACGWQWAKELDQAPAVVFATPARPTGLARSECCSDIDPGVAVVLCECGKLRMWDVIHGWRHDSAAPSLVFRGTPGPWMIKKRVRVAVEFDEEVDREWGPETTIEKLARRFALARDLVPGAPPLGRVLRSSVRVTTGSEPISLTDEEALRALRAPDWNAHVAASPECGERAIDDTRVLNHIGKIMAGELSCPCGWRARRTIDDYSEEMAHKRRRYDDWGGEGPESE